MQYQVITDITPENEPIDLVMAREWIKVEHALEDSLIQSLIESARQLSEKYCNLSFAEKEIELYLDNEDLKYGSYELPFGPHIRITEVTRIDDGIASVINSTEYQVTGYNFLSFHPAKMWTTRSNKQCAYKIKYKAGHGFTTANPSDGLQTSPLPSPIVTAMLKLIADQFEHGGNIVVGTIVAELPYTTRQLLNTYARRVRL